MSQLLTYPPKPTFSLKLPPYMIQALTPTSSSPWIPPVLQGDNAVLQTAVGTLVKGPTDMGWTGRPVLSVDLPLMPLAWNQSSIAAVNGTRVNPDPTQPNNDGLVYSVWSPGPPGSDLGTQGPGYGAAGSLITSPKALLVPSMPFAIGANTIAYTLATDPTLGPILQQYGVTVIEIFNYVTANMVSFAPDYSNQTLGAGVESLQAAIPFSSEVEMPVILYDEFGNATTGCTMGMGQLGPQTFVAGKVYEIHMVPVLALDEGGSDMQFTEFFQWNPNNDTATPFSEMIAAAVQLNKTVFPWYGRRKVVMLSPALAGGSDFPVEPGLGYCQAAIAELESYGFSQTIQFCNQDSVFGVPAAISALASDIEAFFASP